MTGRKLTPVFITGTDTNVGKTVVAGLLADYFSQKGTNVITQKWVQTGCAGASDSDIQSHLAIMQKKGLPLPQQMPYCFKSPFSPHLAAKKENEKINLEKIKADFEYLAQNYESVIVEGAGGVYVPASEDKLLMDLVVRLKLPAVVVAQNRLGAINHSLLTIEYLRVRKVKTIGIIFNNNLPQENAEILADNPNIVHTVSMCPVLGVLPFAQDFAQLKTVFAPIAEKIRNALTR